MTTVAFLDIYKLKPVSEDLFSCSMVISACLKHKSKKALEVAEALTPHMERLVRASKPIKVAGDARLRAQDMSKSWLRWTLQEIDKRFLTIKGTRLDWLVALRVRSKHIQNPSNI